MNSRKQKKCPDSPFRYNMLIFEDALAEFERKGHQPELTALSFDGECAVLHVQGACVECKSLVNPDARVEKCIYKRPRPKLVKSSRSKRKN